MRRSLLIIAASTLGLAGCFGAPAPPPPQGVPPQLGPPPNPPAPPPDIGADVYR